jgi:hypothetical protein
VLLALSIAPLSPTELARRPTVHGSTPYEVSFLGPAKSSTEALFVLNRFIDAIFVLDMAFAFRTCYAIQDGWVTDPERIAKHYLRTWFGIDALSVGVSSVDVLALYADGASLSSLRILRGMRALRLVKLVRVVKGSRIFKRWESRFAIDYAMLEMGKCLTVLLFASHWAGCFWALQATLVSDTLMESWLGTYGYCVPLDLDGKASGVECPQGFSCRDDTPGAACLPPGNLYAASTYWAIMTITSIGYGDIAATAHNAAEQTCASVLMVLCAMLWGYVIGTFCSTIANLSPSTAAFRQNMDDLNAYLASNRVEKQLCYRLREYFFRTRHLLEHDSSSRLLSMMSPMLQAEAVYAVNRVWVERVWFLNSAQVGAQRQASS